MSFFIKKKLTYHTQHTYCNYIYYFYMSEESHDYQKKIREIKNTNNFKWKIKETVFYINRVKMFKNINIKKFK